MQEYGQFCPVALGAEIFAERWTPLILRELLQGSHRFSELRKGLPRISQNLLVQRLAYLEDVGLVERRPRPNGRGYDYLLTTAGEELRPVVVALGTWGYKWTAHAGSDGNPDTTADPSWTPLLATPQFQEYPSAHSGVSEAATSVLASFYGDDTAITATSAGLPGVERTFSTFSDAVAQVVDARIFAGFHFRFSCDDAVAMGAKVADHVTRTVARPVNGEKAGQLGG
jgi:DNA-binding HxlR family transcriptional regulator